MMAIIAFIALGFGVTFELKNHAERDRLLRRRDDCYRQAATHFKRAVECQRAEDAQDPYRPAERAKLLASDGVRSFIPPSGFRSWQVEFQDHLYWGTRFYDQADGREARE
jgi:hypothetical protein